MVIICIVFCLGGFRRFVKRLVYIVIVFFIFFINIIFDCGWLRILLVIVCVLFCRFFKFMVGGGLVWWDDIFFWVDWVFGKYVDMIIICSKRIIL